MKTKAPIYQEDGVIVGKELLNQLRIAVENLEIKMKATLPIYRGTKQIGFGVSKERRGIAADAVISIVKVIKASKGW